VISEQRWLCLEGMEVGMRLVAAITMLLALSSCGTISGVGKGIGYGMGEVMSGVSSDFMAMGDLFNR
jgi:predicted small secreted protein